MWLPLTPPDGHHAEGTAGLFAIGAGAAAVSHGAPSDGPGSAQVRRGRVRPAAPPGPLRLGGLLLAPAKARPPPPARPPAAAVAMGRGAGQG